MVWCGVVWCGTEMSFSQLLICYPENESLVNGHGTFLLDKHMTKQDGSYGQRGDNQLRIPDVQMMHTTDGSK